MTLCVGMNVNMYVFAWRIMYTWIKLCVHDLICVYVQVLLDSSEAILPEVPLRSWPKITGWRTDWLIASTSTRTTMKLEKQNFFSEYTTDIRPSLEPYSLFSLSDYFAYLSLWPNLTLCTSTTSFHFCLQPSFSLCPGINPQTSLFIGQNYFHSCLRLIITYDELGRNARFTSRVLLLLANVSVNAILERGCALAKVHECGVCVPQTIRSFSL